MQWLALWDFACGSVVVQLLAVSLAAEIGLVMIAACKVNHIM